jgi:hypothetical protein
MNILCLGCSYTSWYWPTWPDYLQKLLGTGHQVVNVAHKGDSNFIIAHKLDYCLKNYPWSQIVVMWSGSSRKSLLVDDTNRDKIIQLQGGDEYFWRKIMVNTIGSTQYINLNELHPENKPFFPAPGQLDNYVRSDYDVLLGMNMLQKAGVTCYNMFYHAHQQRRTSIESRLSHVADFSSFNWINNYTDTFPFETVMPEYPIDVHPLPIKQFILAEKICNTLGIDKQNYNQTFDQAQNLTDKINKVTQALYPQITPDNQNQIKLKYLDTIKKFPDCNSRGHTPFSFI